MKISCLITFLFASGTFAGPVKRDCEETCYYPKNSCGVTFGGCWKECEGQRLTFTAPLCSVPVTEMTATATSTTDLASETTLVTLPSDMTAAPSSVPTPTASCNWGMTACVDYQITCGDREIMYGGCDDICSSVSYTAPACTVPAITATMLPMNGTQTRPTKTKAKRPPQSRTPCKSDKDWMCTPRDW